MEVKASEAQGQVREGLSEGSVKQTCEPMNKNRIRGAHCWTSEPPIAKSKSIKSTGRISGGCARKAVELTPGGLRSENGAGVSRGHSRLAIVLTEGPNGALSEEERVNDRQVGSLVS